MSQKSRRFKKIKEYVIKRDGLLCCYCDKILTHEEVTMEHIVPVSKGGVYNTTNLTVSCVSCNNSRGNKNFFEYIKKFNFPMKKIIKYKKLYLSNLKIKILNIAKEELLYFDEEVPAQLIKKACKILRVKSRNFSDYENFLDIKLDEPCHRSKIKFSFEKLIKIIEANSL